MVYVEITDVSTYTCKTHHTWTAFLLDYTNNTCTCTLPVNYGADTTLTHLNTHIQTFVAIHVHTQCILTPHIVMFEITHHDFQEVRTYIHLGVLVELFHQ